MESKSGETRISTAYLKSSGTFANEPYYRFIQCIFHAVALVSELYPQNELAWVNPFSSKEWPRSSAKFHLI